MKYFDDEGGEPRRYKWQDDEAIERAETIIFGALLCLVSIIIILTMCV